MAEHAGIVEALEARDAAALGDRLRRHIENKLKALRRQFSDPR